MAAPRGRRAGRRWRRGKARKTQLAAERQRLQQGERRAEAIAAALAELAPRDRRSAGAGGGAARGRRARCSGWCRRAGGRGQPGRRRRIAALERAEEALAEAETLLTRLGAEADADPRLLEQAEERLFALRAAARKHAVAVAELPGLLDTLSARLAALETGAAGVAALETGGGGDARARYSAAAEALSAARRAAAARLDRAVAKELPPLRLDKARFHAEVAGAAGGGLGRAAAPMRCAS